MKKLLLSSAVIAGLLASSAFADAPSSMNVGVGGFLDFQVGSKSQKSTYKLPQMTAGQQSSAFNNKGTLNVKVSNKADNGLVYGANMGVATNVFSDIKYRSSQFDKTYLFMESGMGRLELGSNYSAAKAMKVDASSIARATGGASDGDWTMYANIGTTGTTVFDGTYYTKADHYLDYLTGVNNLAGDKSEDVRRVTYYSPRYSGVQFGISYALDGSNSGNYGPRTAGNTVGIYNGAATRVLKDVVDVGLNYTQNIDQAVLSLSATGQNGKSTYNSTIDSLGSKHNLSSYNVGASLSFNNMAVAGSVGSVNKKFLIADTATPTINKKGVQYWTAGASYVQGPVGASLTYLNTNFQKNKLSNLAFGVDYQLASGLMPYAEYNAYQLKSSRTTVLKNRGSVFIVGTSLQF